MCSVINGNHDGVKPTVYQSAVSCDPVGCEILWICTLAWATLAIDTSITDSLMSVKTAWLLGWRPEVIVGGSFNVSCCQPMGQVRQRNGRAHVLTDRTVPGRWSQAGLYGVGVVKNVPMPINRRCHPDGSA